jgi:hypothetical protein
MTDERFAEIAGRVRTMRGAGVVTIKRLIYKDLPELVAHCRELRERVKALEEKGKKKEPVKT